MEINLDDLISLAKSGATWRSIIDHVNESTNFQVADKEEKEKISSKYKNCPDIFSFRNFDTAKYSLIISENRKTNVKFCIDSCTLVESTGKHNKLSNTLCYHDCVTCGNETKYEGNPSRANRNCFMCKACQKKVLHKCADKREVYENSILKLYGVRRPLQSKMIHDSMTKTMTERYGHAYTMQSPYLIERHKNSMLKKWGKENYFCNINPAVEFSESFKNLPVRGSRFEREIAEFVSLHDTEAYTCLNRHFYFQTQDGCIIPDVYSKKYSLIIEAYGDYWHANPHVYETNKLFHNGLTMQEILEKDEKRLRHISDSLKCNSIVVWEHDWNNNREACEQRILELMK